MARRQVSPHGQSRNVQQGDTPTISAHVVRGAVSAERDPPQLDSWGNSTLASRGAKTFIKKTQEGGVHHFQGITEAGSRPLLRQPSSTHQSAAPHHADFPCHWPPEALPYWTEDLPCCPPGSGGPSLHDADNSLAHRADSQTFRLRLWDSGSLSPN